MLVRGPSVFHGYLNYHGPDPFVEAAGRRWYVTGDLVQLDEEGYIHFCGRLKRFLKAGGRDDLAARAGRAVRRPLPAHASKARKWPSRASRRPSGRWIVLFTTLDISLRQANAILTDAGFRGVMRLDEVVRLDAIPVLGTGKTDYKVLRKMVAERAAAPT